MKDQQELDLYVDGASRGNPGKAGIGIVIKDREGRKVVEKGRYIGETTNNVAEYSALISGIQEVLRLGTKKVRIFSDSQLLVRQLKGEYKVRKAHLQRLHSRVSRLLQGLEGYDIIYIPREENKEADRLANKAIDRLAR